jgi:hypothetical protein
MSAHVIRYIAGFQETSQCEPLSAETISRIHEYGGAIATCLSCGDTGVLRHNGQPVVMDPYVVDLLATSAPPVDCRMCGTTGTLRPDENGVDVVIVALERP